MPLRIPHGDSSTEIRQAFQQIKPGLDVMTEGASGKVLVGTGIGVTPVWTTDLTSLTLLTVDNITINAATITSDSGAISFGDENLTTTGNFTLLKDNAKLLFGTGADASIYYDGTNMIFNSREMGSGNFYFNSGIVAVGTPSPNVNFLLNVNGNVLIGSITRPYAPDYKLQVKGTTHGFVTQTDLPTSSINGLAFSVSATGEGFVRCNFYSNGFVGFGPGDATRDVFLGRSAANTLRIGTTYTGTGAGNLIVGGNVSIPSDTGKLLFGTESDASIYYDGSDMVIDPKEVGTGHLDIRSVVVGVLPTDSNHLATKEYVDNSVHFIFEYFFNDTASSIGGIYYKMLDEHTGEAESSFTTAGLGTNDNQALVNFATDAGAPGVDVLESGVYTAHFHIEKTVGTKPVKVYCTFVRYEADTTETVIATSEVSEYITSKVELDLHAVIFSDVQIAVTDRIVIKFYANVEATGSAVTVVLYAEGTTSSHVALPITTEVLDSIFLRQDGTKDLTGNMLVDAAITIDGRDLSVDGIKLDGIEALADVTDATNVTAAGAAMAGGAFHDGFSDFVSAEHIDWTNATDNFLTTGTITETLSASAAAGVFIDGDTNPFTTSQTTCKSIQANRTINYGTGNLAASVKIVDYTVTLDHTNAKIVHSSAAIYGFYSLSDNNATVTNESASNRAYRIFGFGSFIDDDGTYDTTSSGRLSPSIYGASCELYLNPTFTRSAGAAANTIYTAIGSTVVIRNYPTLSSGGLTQITTGIRVNIIGNTTGTSSAYGINIYKVEGCDTNWGIYDESGANWALHADSQKIMLGGDADASIYYDGTDMIFNSREVGTGDFYFNGGGVHASGIKSGTDQADAGAATGELYSDTNDDNTVKMGV